MNSKTTLILVLALLLAVAGIWWLRPAADDSNDEKDTGPVKLLALDADDVTAFEIKSGDEPACSFVKENGDWRMTSPISGPAQSRTVADDVRQLTNLKYDKAYAKNDDPPGDDLTSLSKPHRVAKLTDSSGKSHVLRIGNQQALSSRTYVSREGDDKIYLIDADLNQSLKRKLEDYRGKRVTSINAADVIRIEVVGDASFTAAKQASGWAIESPEKARADLTTLNKIINGIANLSVTKFIDDTPDSLRIYGLEPPRVSVTLVSKNASAPAGSEDEEGNTTKTTVAFGSPIEESVFARLTGDDSQTVFEVPKTVLDNVAPALSAVRDKRIVELMPMRVQTFTLTTQSGQSLTLSRDGVNWLIAPSGPMVPSQVAEPVAVNDVLNTLRDLKADGFEESARPEFGLDNPRMTLKIEQQGKPDPVVLKLGALTPSRTGAYIRNETEDFIAVIPIDAAGKLVVEPVAFQSRNILSLKPERVASISIRALSQSITLRRENDSWQMASPIDAAADNASVNALLKELSSLKGRAVVASADRRNEFGLMQPQYTLELTVTRPAPTTMPAGDDVEPPAPETIVLFASRHGGKRYAMLQNGDFIYEVEEKLIADLDAEYLDTQILSFDAAKVNAVSFTTPDGSFRFVRNGEKWTLEGESTFQVGKPKLDAVVNALSTLKAKRYTAYENAEATALGLAAPQLRIRVDLADDSTHELVISSIGPNAADRYAQLAAQPGRAFVLEGTDVTKFDKRAADFKK